MTTQSETQAIVKMVKRREKFARTMHQSIYADDLASVLSILTRQEEEIDRRKCFDDLVEASSNLLKGMDGHYANAEDLYYLDTVLSLIEAKP